MALSVSIHDLHNRAAEVVAAVRAGEQVTLTVNCEPLGDIVPHVEHSDPWVTSSVLRRIVHEASADDDLLIDLAGVRGTLVEEVRECRRSPTEQRQ